MASRPLEVSCRTDSPLWSQRLPSLTYASVPATFARGSTWTMFEGVGVLIGPPPPPPPATIGSWPVSSAMLRIATTARPRTEMPAPIPDGIEIEGGARDGHAIVGRPGPDDAAEGSPASVAGFVG